MTRVPVLIGIVTLLLAGTASPIDWKSQSFATKRQVAGMVIDCMKKRMSRDRQVSYNEAAKQCKQEVTRQFDNPPSGPLVADTKP
jgi:hypothetical protein